MEKAHQQVIEQNSFTAVHYYRVVETKDRSAEDIQIELNRYGHEGFDISFHIGTVLILQREIEL